MPGLDPGIHLHKILATKMDCRVKPGNDAQIESHLLVSLLQK
jgi:hypothetical protein